MTSFSDQRSSNGTRETINHQENSGTSSLYATCSRVPLIKSPAVRVPPPIVLPNNLHPLPPNLQDYFVYPFNLEHFVLDNADRREKARKQDLLKRAPGWNEDGKVLEPTRRPTSIIVQDNVHQQSIPSSSSQSQSAQQNEIGINERNEIDEIAEMLDRLEKK